MTMKELAELFCAANCGTINGNQRLELLLRSREFFSEDIKALDVINGEIWRRHAGNAVSDVHS